jgi:bifunctional non-homologous end joining protein LigD
MENLTKVKFTNVDKILYPELAISKLKIIKYYISVAYKILPFLKNRALVRTRYPDGIHRANFYERDTPYGKPDWVETYKKFSKTSKKEINYILCNDLDTLLYLINLASIELHIPLSKIPETDKPDLVLFDLDPEPPAGIKDAIKVAFILKEKLEIIGNFPYVKTSGKKGLHILIPIIPEYTFDETRKFVHDIGVEIAKKSQLIVSERTNRKKPGTVMIDYPQNSERASMIAPYSLRAVREATLSTPLEWNELENIHQFDYNLYSIENRKIDSWKDLFKNKQSLNL